MTQTVVDQRGRILIPEELREEAVLEEETVVRAGETGPRHNDPTHGQGQKKLEAALRNNPQTFAWWHGFIDFGKFYEPFNSNVPDL